MNLSIVVLIWLMIVPMMKIDFASIRHVSARPARPMGFGVTLFVDWIIKPFSAAFFA